MKHNFLARSPFELIGVNIARVRDGSRESCRQCDRRRLAGRALGLDLGKLSHIERSHVGGPQRRLDAKPVNARLDVAWSGHFQRGLLLAPFCNDGSQIDSRPGFSCLLWEVDHLTDLCAYPVVVKQNEVGTREVPALDSERLRRSPLEPGRAHTRNGRRDDPFGFLRADRQALYDCGKAQERESDERK